jgi:HEAT repeat protein
VLLNGKQSKIGGTGVRVKDLVARRLGMLQCLDFTNYAARPWDGLEVVDLVLHYNRPPPGRIMRHIFVSYCREDADFAQILEDKIKRSDFPTWKDQNLNAGDDWRAEIDDAIRAALAVIVILSPVSVNSTYLHYEWAFARGCGVPIIPILLAKLTIDGLHPSLRMLQCLDFSNYAARPWDALMEVLRKQQDSQRGYTVHVPRDAPPVVQQAARTLDSMDEAERKAAISSLGQMNHPSAVEVLVEATRHPIRQVRIGASVALAGFKDARAVTGLLEGIRHGDKEADDTTISELGKGAIPALLRALRDEHRGVRSRAFRALGRLGGPEVVDVMVERLRDADAGIRYQAAYALELAADAAALPALREAAHDPDRDVRRVVSDALVKCGRTAAIPILAEMLQDPDREVRSRVAAQFREIPDAAAIPSLINILDDNDIGDYAARALAAIGDKETIPALVRALNNRSVLYAATSALETFGTRAAPALREAAQNPNPWVRENVISLLGKIADPADVPLFLNALSDEHANVRLSAIFPLWHQRTAQAVPALIERLHDEDEEVAWRATQALGEIGDPRAVAPLIECLKEDESAKNASEALEALGTKEARAAVKAWKRQNKK